MKVHLRFLRQAGQLQQALQADGWELQRNQDQSLVARHFNVPDEPSARSRLHRLGLLTSASVCIEFHRNDYHVSS